MLLSKRRGFGWVLCAVVSVCTVCVWCACTPTVPVDNTNTNTNGNDNSDPNSNDNGNTNTNDNTNTNGNTNTNNNSSTSDCGNGVVEAGEDCDPPDGQTCDNDCQDIVVPVCGDGIIDAGEDCDPPNGTDCDENCKSIDAPAVCGNGRIEGSERCDPPDGVTCDTDCQPITTGGGGSTCGNGTIDAGETCDPPDGNTCDANCQTTTGGGLANDSCASPTTVTEGTRNFTNVGATTDGPVACEVFQNSLIDSDIWYCFTAACDEQVTVSLCGSLYDTKAAVYVGCDCPTEADLTVGCSDDDCGAGQESRMTFSALAGQDYLIRVGGYFDGTNTTNQGEGTLSIFCESDVDHGLNTCRATSGDCFTTHDSAGCNNVDVCTTTCTADPYCCDGQNWDALCVQKADGIANGFDTCGPGNGSCFVPDGTAGCDNATCCQSVCESDPYCCLTEWDEFCSAAVPSECGIFEACIGARGTCFDIHTTPGCDDSTCCTDVCTIDSVCCSDGWDDVCTNLATQNCAP